MNADGDPVLNLSVFPLIFDYTSFRTRNRGIIYSFLIDYDNGNLFLPGIGIRFKNSAKLYAQTSIVLYAGADVSSGAAFATLSRVSTEIGYNISSQFSINALAGIYISPIVFLFNIVPDDIDMMNNLQGYIQMFSLGASYRF